MTESEEFLTVQIQVHGRNSSTSWISKTTTKVFRTKKWSVNSQNEGLTKLYESMFRQVTRRNETANFISLNLFSHVHSITSWYITKHLKVSSFIIVYVYTTYEQKYVRCLHRFKAIFNVYNCIHSNNPDFIWRTHLQSNRSRPIPSSTWKKRDK